MRPADRELAIKARCLTDRVLFVRTFFGDKADKEFSPFHLAALRAPKVRYRDREAMSGWRRARMGPRGNGKTTIYIRAEVVHDIVYEFEEYVLVLAESASLARSRVREIAAELESNALLKHFFGDLKGDVWRKGMGEIETGNGVSIIARSRRGQVRGLLHPVTNARPTKVIADDFEHSDEVLNPELREKDAVFWRQDVEGGGSTDGRTCFQITGTPLHREALLPSLKHQPGWDFAAYPAILSWPKRMDLWERCRRIFVSAGFREEGEGDQVQAGPGAIELAHAYYQANRKAMDAEAEVLWPDGEPLFALMVWRWTNGEAAFSKEKLLVPRDPSLATFEMESDEYPRKGALRHTRDGDWLVVDQRDGPPRKVRVSDLRVVTFHDPAKADPSSTKKRRTSLGDYACITAVGFETLRNGASVAHVLDAWMRREPPSKQVEAHFALAEQHRAGLCILEQDSLGLLRDAYRREARRRREADLYATLPLHALQHQVTNKEARIAGMEPAVANGWLTFGRNLPREFWLQFVDHPTGDHDDGPDSTEGAWRFGSRRGRKGLVAVTF